ncbi:MAG: ABC transporter ATP-binding protein [Acidimicrobiales bacterium]
MNHSDAAPDTGLPPAIPSLLRTVRIGYRAEPRLLLVSFVMVLFTALPDALIALWLSILADGVLDGSRPKVVWAALGLGLSATLTWFLRTVLDRIERRFRDRVSVALESHVAQLQASVPTIEHHERPDYLDRLSVLRDQVFALDHLFMSLFSTMGWVFRLIITLVLLATVHPLLLVLVVFALPTVYTATWRPGIERKVEESVAQHNRRARHLFSLVTLPHSAKEVRLSGNAQAIKDRRNESWTAWWTPLSATRRNTALWHSLAWAIFGAAYVGAIVFVAEGLGSGPSAVLLVLVAGSRLSMYVGAAVGELGFLRGIWLDSSQRLAWLEDYAAAADESADLDAPDHLAHGIDFEAVDFTYPGTQRKVLDSVDLHLPAGAVVAIVGENGAGKTTLVKLLARMYAPSAGRITADGVDIARFTTRSWRSRLAGAFQDFFRFEFAALTSVGVGDEPHIDDRPAVGAAVGRAGADDVVSGLAAGLDTQLGPSWEGGVELSHGQWQKVALARGFMRSEPLVQVLDEPTSALDAETENALFEHYAAAARGSDGGRITILISHRFSTVRMADLIVVLDGAKVVEVGSHAELMAAKGHYADLYETQSSSYR